MNYQAIVNAIRDTATSVNPTGTFTHGRGSDQANVPHEHYPRINLYPFTQTRTGANLYTRSTTLLLYFVDLDTGDNDMSEREATIAAMQELVDAFIALLESDFESEIQIGNVKDEPLYNILEGVTGYGLSIDIVTVDEC